MNVSQSSSKDNSLINNTFLILSDDRYNRNIINKNDFKNTVIIIDKSNSFMRIIGLLIKRKLDLFLVFKMFCAELYRKKSTLEKKVSIIQTNQDLIKLYSTFKPENIFLFRTSLILRGKILESDVNLYNVHCASLPEFRGLGAINRAINERKFNQNATMHVVSEKVDEGLIIDIEQFELNEKLSYRENEEISFDAGLTMLKRHLIYKD